MNEQDYELISAYIDNELSDSEREQVNARLLQDKEFESIFLEFKNNDLQLLEHYSKIDEKPVPNEILNLLKDSSQISQKSESDKPEELVANNVTQNFSKQRAWYQAGLSLAASALFVALVSYYYDYSDGALFDSQLATILDSNISGKSIEINTSERVYLSMSFLNKDGYWCREFFIIATTTTQNISCRFEQEWQNEISIPAEFNEGNSYMPASSNDNYKIETWLDNNMGSDPLSNKQEQELMQTN